VEDTIFIDQAVITGNCCLPGTLHKTFIYYGSTKQAPKAVSELFYDEK